MFNALSTRLLSSRNVLTSTFVVYYILVITCSHFGTLSFLSKLHGRVLNPEPHDIGANALTTELLMFKYVLTVTAIVDDSSIPNCGHFRPLSFMPKIPSRDLNPKPLRKMPNALTTELLNSKHVIR
jgi:hypothetical protein